MRLKSFHAKTMSEAMKLVRQTLGDDAIIVATKEEEGGGVRVTAAVEEEDRFAAQQAKFARSAAVSEPEIDVGEEVAETLHRHGVPTMLADQLIDIASGVDTNDPALALAAAFDSLFAFQPIEERRGTDPRVLVLVGPPGGGKTLAVAKLAARAVLAKRSVGVISTDTVRAGGLDQLNAFTRILKVKLASVEDPDALAGAIDVHGKADLVLVDTAGRNPFDPADMDDLKSFLAACKAEPVLVLPGGLDAFEAMDVAGAFKGLGVRRVLATRLDATRRFGSLLVTLHRARLAFSDCCHSPKVAEGISPLKPVSLARMMLPRQEKPPVSKPARTASAKPLTKSSSRTLP
jgi:flagellar biosynthesis protein FlhF